MKTIDMSSSSIPDCSKMKLLEQVTSERLFDQLRMDNKQVAYLDRLVVSIEHRSMFILVQSEDGRDRCMI